MVKRTKVVAIAGSIVLVLTASGCGGGDDDSSPAGGDDTTAVAGQYCPEGEGGQLVWAHNQEPGTMQWSDPENFFGITAWIHQGLLEGLYGIDSTSSFFPELLEGEADVQELDGGAVAADFTLRDNLAWSDGEALTSDDVRFTYDVIMEGYDVETAKGGKLLFSSRAGYDKITDFKVVSDTEFTVTFDSYYAGFRQLFDEVYPEHAFGDGGAAAVNEQMAEWTDIPSSGPLLYEGRQRGVSMTLARNDSYHGSTSPDTTNTGASCIDSVLIKFVPDSAALMNALQSGESYIVLTQAQTEFGDLIEGSDTLGVASKPGGVSEHVGMNLLNPHLAKLEVREAIAYAFDKPAIVETLYTPLFGDSLPAEGLGNTYWMSNQPAYENHQADYANGDVDKAKAELEAAGYTMGDDGIYEHPTDGRLELSLGTTGGNRFRELQEELIQAQLREAGIEIAIDNLPGTTYFGERVFSADALLASSTGGAEGDPNLWDLTMFGWTTGPWPGVQHQAYLSSSAVAPYGYNDPAFDAKAAECDSMIDQAEQDACYNELDTYVTTPGPDGKGLFMIPISASPQFYAYRTDRVQEFGEAPEFITGGPFTDVVDFVLKQ
jgi:peptide/nickel transport system substrate-binding protein